MSLSVYSQNKVIGWSRARPHAVALLLYLLLAVIMTWPLVTRLTQVIPGDGFDGWQNYWNLWWMRQAWLVEHSSAYVTPLLHYPIGADLRFQTMAPFNGLMFLNVQLAGNVFLAYNAAVLFSFVAGGFGAYLLALYALRSQIANLSILHRTSVLHGAAFVAGIVFAFSPYHFAHLLGHLQLIALQWIPFFILYLLRGLDRAFTGQLKPADILKSSLFLIFVGLCDWYYVMYCLFFSALILIVRLLQRRLNWIGVGAVVATGGLFALALAPLLVPMVQAAGTWGGTSLLRDYNETVTLSADLLAYVTPQVFHPVWGDWAATQSSTFTATRSEFTVFMGYLVLVLAGVATWTTRKSSWRSAAAWLIGAGFFFVLSLGPVLHIDGRTELLPNGGQIPLPYGMLYDSIPFIKLSRSVSRMDVMVMLCLGVAVAFGVAYLANWFHRRRFRALWAIPVVAGSLILFEFLPIPYPVSPPDTPDWYHTLAQEPEQQAVLNLPANWPRPGYLLYQTVHGKPMSTGYVTRDDPNTLWERAPVLSQFRWLGPDIHTKEFDLGTQGMQVLHDLLGVRWVVLDRYKMPGGLELSYTEEAAQAIFEPTGQPPIYEDERLTVYEVQPPSERRPYLILGADWSPRQADESGTIWRDLYSAGASLELVKPAAGDFVLELSVQGKSGAVLRLVDDAGSTLAEWQLTGQVDKLRSPSFSQAAGQSRLRLEQTGPADAPVVIYSVDVRTNPQ